MSIRTNNHPRPLVTWNDLPERARLVFDYVDDDDRWSDRFVRYRGEWHDVCDMVGITSGDRFTPFGHNVDKSDPLAQWDGIATDSFWSAVVVRYLRGDERVNYAPDEDGYVIMGSWSADD